MYHTFTRIIHYQYICIDREKTFHNVSLVCLGNNIVGISVVVLSQSRGMLHSSNVIETVIARGSCVKLGSHRELTSQLFSY